jgi:hypothetical protein
MPKFRTKLGVIEAVQWTGEDQAWSAICALHANGVRSADEPTAVYGGLLDRTPRNASGQCRPMHRARGGVALETGVARVDGQLALISCACALSSAFATTGQIRPVFPNLRVLSP